MKLRIMADQIASASVSVTTVGNEIKQVLGCDVEIQRVDDRYGDYQVGGAINPRGILARYEGRQDKELRLIVTGYELRLPDSSVPLISRKGAATVVSTNRIQGSPAHVAVAAVHGLFHQISAIPADAPQHDPHNPGHCKNRCVMRPVEDLGALRRVVADWGRGNRLCRQCQALVPRS